MACHPLLPTTVSVGRMAVGAGRGVRQPPQALFPSLFTQLVAVRVIHGQPLTPSPSQQVLQSRAQDALALGGVAQESFKLGSVPRPHGWTDGGPCGSHASSLEDLVLWSKNASPRRPGRELSLRPQPEPWYRGLIPHPQGVVMVILCPSTAPGAG